MRIILTGGGTGGHVYPAISIAEALRDVCAGSECDLLYLGSRNGPEAHLADAAGIEFCGLTSRKMGKLLSPEGILTVASFGKGFSEAFGILRKFKPDLVIGTGGYASAAVVMAGRLRGGKTLIHEQNVLPGRTNLWLSKFVSKICVTFEDSMKHFPKGKTVVTGLPIRSELLLLPDKKAARAAMGLNLDVFTILVLGGSQGAKKLNQIVGDSIAGLKGLPIQIMHQAGQKNFEEAEERCKSAGWQRYNVRPYLDDMQSAYGAADLVICRCGASTIAEITAIGLPAILVPYPYAYADHQRYNGEFVAGQGGGILICEADLNNKLLVSIIRRLVGSKGELARMAASSKKLGRPNAAHEIATIAVEMIRRSGK